MFSEMAGIVLLSTGVFRVSPNVCFLGNRLGGGRGEGPHGAFPCSSLSLWSISHLPLFPGGGGRGLLTLGPALLGGMILGKCLRPCFLPGVHVIPRTHASLQWSPPATLAPLASSLPPTSGRCHVKISSTCLTWGWVQDRGEPGTWEGKFLLFSPSSSHPHLLLVLG